MLRGVNQGPKRRRQQVVRLAAHHQGRHHRRQEIELEDKFENMGAQMVREVTSKTNDFAGDGTTTAALLAQAIVRQGAVALGHEPR